MPRLFPPDETPPTLLDGLVLGLGAASLFLAALLPRPSFRRYGVEADWDQVGRDLSQAMGPPS